MEKHTANYIKAFGYDKSSFIPCEMCSAPSVDIHHCEPRSKFGSKRKEEQDAVGNLIALCRICHEFAHGENSRKFKMKIKEVINNRKYEQRRPASNALR